jgi:hypothetical protein
MFNKKREGHLTIPCPNFPYKRGVRLLRPETDLFWTAKDFRSSKGKGSPMKMLVRLRYLLEEGFEVSSMAGYDDDSGEGNARLMYI